VIVIGKGVPVFGSARPGLLRRGGMNDKIVRRIFKHTSNPEQHILHDSTQFSKLPVVHQGKVMGMMFRIKPQFERKAGCIRSHDDKLGSFIDDTSPFFQFELDQITENTAFMNLVKLPADMQLLGRHRGG